MSKGLLYVEIADDVRAEILSGKYPVDSYLPTESEFEEIYDVSRITVRKAIDILVEEGYVVKRSGKGTRVVSDRLFNQLSKAVSYSTILERDHKLEKDLLSFEAVSLKDDHPVYSYFGDKAYRLERVYRLDGDVFIYFVHYFKYFESNIDLSFDRIKTYSIYRWLADNNLEPRRFKDEFSVVQPEQYILDCLGTDVTHTLLRTRGTRTNNNELVEISLGYYNTDAMPYIIEYEI